MFDCDSDRTWSGTLVLVQAKCNMILVRGKMKQEQAPPLIKRKELVEYYVSKVCTK